MKAYLLLPFLIVPLFLAPVPGYGQEQNIPTKEEPSFQSPYLSSEYSPQAANPREPLMTEERLSSPEVEDFQSKFFKMLFLLGLLIGFMFFASWLLKRMSRSRATNLNQGSDIKVLETRYLSPRATLHLLDVHGKNILIAESPMGVSHISSFRSIEDDEFRTVT